MKISDVIVTPIAISDPPLLNAAGLHAPFALRIIVEIQTAEGLYGLGEIPGSIALQEPLQRCKELLLGQDPFQLNSIEYNLRQALRSLHARQIAAIVSVIEVACLDVMGKAVGRSVADLLGGKVRDEVEFSAYLFYKYEGAGGNLGFATRDNAVAWDEARQKEALKPADIVSQAQAMVAAYGFRSLKLKAGVFEPDQEVEAILALRDAFGPQTPIRIDPNAVWSVDTGIRCGKALEGVIEYYEDPVRGQEAMAQLRQVLTVPLATNMCTTSFADIPEAIRLGSEDIILSDHHFWGGLRATVKLASLCAIFKRGLSMHSNSHLGISLAAMVHVAAVLPNLTFACDTHYPWQYEEVIMKPLTFERGAIRVPEAPGLGVELDREALARLHEQFVRSGIKERNDELAMQQKQPGWKFQKTRW